MNLTNFPFKDAEVEELNNGRYRLVLSDETRNTVADIEFNNRKAARNWARSRGFRVVDHAPDGSTMHGPN